MKKYVNGIEVKLTPQEVAERQAEEAAYVATIESRQKLIQIQELESQITPRRIREAIVTQDYTFIQGIETQITNLRNQL